MQMGITAGVFITRTHLWNTGRELSSDWLVVYIDAKEIEVKSGGKVKKMVIISGIGVNMEGKKELLGSLVFEGRETLSC